MILQKIQFLCQSFCLDCHFVITIIHFNPGPEENRCSLIPRSNAVLSALQMQCLGLLPVCTAFYLLPTRLLGPLSYFQDGAPAALQEQGLPPSSTLCSLRTVARKQGKIQRSKTNIMDCMGPKGILEEYCQKEFRGGTGYTVYSSG